MLIGISPFFSFAYLALLNSAYFPTRDNNCATFCFNLWSESATLWSFFHSLFFSSSPSFFPRLTSERTYIHVHTRLATVGQGVVTHTQELPYKNEKDYWAAVVDHWKTGIIIIKAHKSRWLCSDIISFSPSSVWMRTIISGGGKKAMGIDIRSTITEADRPTTRESRLSMMNVNAL